MKNSILGLSSIAILFLSTSLVDAKSLSSNADWSIRKVNAEKPYCTLSRTYNGNIKFTIAKNASGEGTLALDFNRDAFDTSRAYPIKFLANGLSRKYSVSPANSSVIIIRLGQDEPFFDALSNMPNMDVTIDQETFEVDLTGTKDGLQNFTGCLGGVTQEIATRSVVPVQSVSPQDVANQNNQISELVEENRRLTTMLTKVNNVKQPVSIPKNDPMVAQLRTQLEAEQQKNFILISQVEKLEKELASTGASINPDISAVVLEKDKQIKLLMSQNTQLKSNLDDIQMQLPKVVVKEIIKEVPVSVSGDLSDTTIELAEAEAKANSYQAERDEYRRLLQVERRRLREGVDVAGQITNATNSEGSLVSDVRRLEKEKAELIRQLEFAKTTGKVVEISSKTEGTASKLNELSLQLSEAQKKLNQAEVDKQKLKKRMAVIDAEAVMIQRQLAESKIAKLADDSPRAIKQELEAKTLRSEIAALEAQNNMLKTDIGIEKQKVERISRPVDIDSAQKVQSFRNRLQQQVKNDVIASPIIPVQMANISQSSKVVQLTSQMKALSGDEIRQLVSQSKIPLKSSVDRIDRVSGPDFAAFRWDTGFVYGSGEQSRLSDISAFNNSIQQYIQKTASRCEGSFDQNIQSLDTANGMTVKSADIACVDDNAEGSAASILFFVRDGMFYALAHEADMDSFKVAMDMRDRLAGSIDKIF